jgi:hypothetical protein
LKAEQAGGEEGVAKKINSSHPADLYISSL